MSTIYNSRPEDTFDDSLISPQQSMFPMENYGGPSTTSHRGSIGGLSTAGGMDDDDFAAFQSSLFPGSRVPSLSPSYLSASANSNSGFSNTSNQGLSPPHSFSSASPRSNFSGGAAQTADDFMLNFGQDDLDILLFKDPGLMLGTSAEGAGGKGVGAQEPVFHLPKDWSFQYGQPQQQQPSYPQPQQYNMNPTSNGTMSGNAFHNLHDFSNLTSPKSTSNPPMLQNNYSAQPQSAQELRRVADAAEQARAAANRELEEVRRQQMLQAEQIQALQRAQQQGAVAQNGQLQAIPPSWMNRAPDQGATQYQQMQGAQNWGGIIPPTLPPAINELAKPAAPAAPRKGRPPKSARPAASGESTSPPEQAGGKHNKTERRYRQKVQVAQAELRDAVPALRVHYGTSTAEQKLTTDFRAADGTVDGLGEVSRPNASAKATILNGARLYIELLQSRLTGMQRKIDELEAYRVGVAGQADLERWRTDFDAREAARQAAFAKVKKEEMDVIEMDGSDSESEDEAPKKRKRGPAAGGAAGKKKKAEAESSGNGVRVFAAFAMSFSLVPSASTLLRHQPVGDISPGHVLSGEATPTQVISRLPLITAEHVYRVFTKVLPSAVVPTPGVMVDWTWRLLVAAVLVLVLGPIIRAWTKGEEEHVPAGDLVEMGKDAVKLGLRIKGEEDEEWVEYGAKVLGKAAQPTALARLHLAMKLRRTATTPYALALLALTQPETRLLPSPSATWQQARARLSAEDPAALQAVLALPFEEAKNSLALLPTTSSPIPAIAEQITLVHLNDLYSRFFTRLVDSTISHTSLPISVTALIDNLSSKSLKADLSTFDQEIRDTMLGVSRGTAAHALGLVLIGLWGVFSGPAPSAQASLASALAGEEINGGGAGLSSVSSMLDLLYPGAAQSVVAQDRLRLSALPQNAIALDKLALVCIAYVTLLYTCGASFGGVSKADKARAIGRATADLRLVISECKFVGLDTVAGSRVNEEEEEEEVVELNEEDEADKAVQKMEGEMRRFEEAKERLVGVLSVIGRRAAGRADAGEDSGLDAEIDEL